jgi:hypothetical protein
MTQGVLDSPHFVLDVVVVSLHVSPFRFLVFVRSDGLSLDPYMHDRVSHITTGIYWVLGSLMYELSATRYIATH